MARCRVVSNGELAPRQSLQAHPRGQEAARERDCGLVAPDSGHRTAPEGGGLAACPCFVIFSAVCARSRTAKPSTKTSPTKWRAIWNGRRRAGGERAFSR